MPYEIQRYKYGFRVVNKETKEAYSKRPLTKYAAEEQMKALYANEPKFNMKGSGSGSPEEQQEKPKITEEEVMAYSLSNTDIQKLLPGIKIISYPELHNYDTIDEVLDKQGRCIILYLTENANTGHWIALLKRGNTIEFFDPYGGMWPDDQAEWLSPEKLRELDQEIPRLTQLLEHSNYKLTNNPYHLQQDKDDINTCGRHCVTRLSLKNLPIDKYKDVVTGTKLPADKYVAYYTYEQLKK